MGAVPYADQEPLHVRLSDTSWRRNHGRSRTERLTRNHRGSQVMASSYRNRAAALACVEAEFVPRAGASMSRGKARPEALNTAMPAQIAGQINEGLDSAAA